MDQPYEATLGVFLDALGSAQPTPGSGAAAAVAIALAAGCLRKAISVTLKHRPDPDLPALGEQAAALVGAALAGLSEEAAAFRDQLTSPSPAAGERSRRVAEGLRTCAAGALDLAARLADKVEPVVAGDLVAAKALVAAATAILTANQLELDA